MIVITGASDGLGKELAKICGEAGKTVVNISRTESQCAKHNIRCDLSMPEAVLGAVKTLQGFDEAIEAIIFNAGVLSLGEFSVLDVAEYDRVVDVNLRAPMLLLSRLLGRLKGDESDIAVINSRSGRNPHVDQEVYDMSKWGLRGLTDDIRLRLKDTKCRVVGIYPGMIDTDMAQKLPSGPMPKSKHAMIPPDALAQYIKATLDMPKAMEVSEAIINRK